MLSSSVGFAAATFNSLLTITHNKCIRYVLFIVNIELLLKLFCCDRWFDETFPAVVGMRGGVICPNYINLKIVVN